MATNTSSSSSPPTLKSVNPEACKKIIALVNSKSGERNSAEFLMSHLKSALGPAKVVDLSTCFKDQSPAINLIKTDGADGVVIVGGGDGTVSWVMDLVDQVDWAALGGDSHRPYITVVPMGTGNDLSRSLGLGPGFTKERCCCACSGCCDLKNLDQLMAHSISDATIGNLDRWNMVVSEAGVVVDKHPVNNYMSIGFDASIARKFDTFRKNHPKLCAARVMNKMWYGCFGLGALCGNPTLEKIVTLTVDGKDIPVPSGIKSLVVTNIDSFAGGCKLWKDAQKKHKPMRLDDAMVEICGMYGSTHMAFMQSGMRSAVKIAQGSHIVIKTSQHIALQWDGEYMYKNTMPCEIVISPLSQPKILHQRKEKK